MKAHFHAAFFSLPFILSIAAAAQAPANQTCPIDQRPPGQADESFYRRNYTDAERLYREALAADPASAEAMAGIVRTTLAEDKLTEALALATQYDAARPHNPLLLDALGEVRFRRGEVDAAAIAFNQSFQLDPCNGITRYDMYSYLELSGMYASAQHQLDFAHGVSPNNRRIGERWVTSHHTFMTPQQTLDSLQRRLQNPSLPAGEKDGIQATIAGLQAREKGDCELVSPVTSAKLPLVAVGRNGSVMSQDMYAAGLDILFNGKRQRLIVDTGASGLLLTRDAAKAAGLVSEVEAKAGGIGNQGAAAAFITHVDDIRVGSMEFKNCMVHVLEQNRIVLDNTDGLIGPDVFRNFVVTLDIPSRELRLGPLPPLPGESAAQPTSLITSDDNSSRSIADRARDRYVAPEMKDWTPVFRSDHFLIFRTLIGNAPVKLFVMDTGAAMGMISPAAAREVTHVADANPDAHVQGLSGEVKKVLVADDVTIAFAKVRQLTQGMASFDGSSLTRSAGVEISGLIGFPTLRQLVISIDYRDNLVHVVYDPKHGYH